MTNLKRSLLLLVYLILLISIGGMAWWTDDLKQENRETLFMDQTAKQAYLSFTAKIIDRPMVVGLMTQAKSERWQRFQQQMSELATQEEIEFYDLHSLLKVRAAQPLSDRDHPFALYLPPPEHAVNSDHILLPISKQVHLMGLPYINALLNTYSDTIKTKIFPILFALTLILLLFITRHLGHTWLLFQPALFALLIPLVLIRHTYHTLDMITSIIPLMVFVITLTMSLHLYFTQQQGHFRQILRIKLLPIGLAMLTTIIGFGSLILSPIESIQRFALMTSLSLLLALLTTLGHFALYTPLFFQTTMRPPSWTWCHRLLEWGQQKISVRFVLLLSLIVLISAIYCWPKIPLLTDATRYFPANSGFHNSFSLIERTIEGNPNLEILITMPTSENNFGQWQTLATIEQQLQSQIGSQKIRSANQLVRTLNLAYTGQNQLPPFQISYVTLYAQLIPPLRQAYPIENHTYRLTLTGPTLNANEYTQLTVTVEATLKQHLPPHTTFQLGGLQYGLMQAQSALITILFQSFLSSLLLIALLTLLYFRSLSVVAIFLLVNLMPIASALIFMTVTDLSLNVATVMAFSVSLGLVVDGTIHILHDHVQNRPPQEQFKQTTLPILMSTLILAIGFASFITNDFLPIRQIGLVLTFTLLVGFIYDLYFLKPLMARFLPRSPSL